MGKITVSADSNEVKALVDDLPSANESDQAPTLASPGEPAPFDPLSVIDVEPSDIESPVAHELAAESFEIDEEAEKEAEKNSMPTSESIAAELKEVAEHPIVMDDEYEEEPIEEQVIAAPVPPAEKKKKSHAPLVIIMLAVIAVTAGVALFAINSQTASEEAKRAEEAAKQTSAKPKDETKLYEYVMGSWQSQAEGGSCYVMSEDDSFYWLRDCNNFNDNYYYGHVGTIKYGDKALKEIGMTFEAVKHMMQFEEDFIRSDDVYLINLETEKRVINGVDTTGTLVQKTIKLLLVRTEGNSKAYGYQYNSGDIYVFRNEPGIIAPIHNYVPLSPLDEPDEEVDPFAAE